MPRRRICVVTGSRAEYGLLYWIIKEIQNDSELELQLVVTGMHMSSEYGHTFQLIEADGIKIDAKVEMLLSSDSAIGISKSLGLGVIGLAGALDRLEPDFLVILGDRFEIFAAAQAATIARIPIAHIAGGDTTEGSFDEVFRHGITKMSHLHFVTNEKSASRVRQLGENPAHIFNVGSPGIDYIKRAKLLSRRELEQALEFTFKEINILVTFHPVTLETHSAGEQFQELVSALHSIGSEIGIVFTRPNSDNDSQSINRLIDKFVENHANAVVFQSLGQDLYLSVMAEVNIVAGNSSSGLYETPSFGKPTVNIGDRQKGRLQASSVINCVQESAAILEAISLALSMECSEIINPYGDGNSSIKIKNHLKQIEYPRQLLKKHFFDLSDRSV